MSTVQAETEITQIKRLLRFLGDTPAMYPEWEKRVLQHSVSGKSAHDARIVAAMTVHHLSHVLTFNADDFKRFSDIDVLTPDDVLTGKLPLPPTKDTEE